MSDLDPGFDAPSAPVILSFGRHAPDDAPPLEPSANLETIETETRHYRHDGWTPAARVAFLDMLAKSGVVTDACREVQRSSQAAYALRNRDRLFAAGWDAALSMARARLADDLFHRSVHGTVEQIWKDGEVVAERHRHDNRLSIAVLNRLDARSDRAERVGAPVLRVAAEWDSWLAAISENRTADAEALLAPPPPAAATLGQGNEAMLIRQLHQLRQGKALDQDEALAAQADDGDDGQRVWFEDSGWRTDYPPPDDFEGVEDGDYGDEDYSRPCTPEECDLLDRAWPDALEEEDEDEDEEELERRADGEERDAWFADLAAALVQQDEADDPAPSRAEGEEVDAGEAIEEPHDPLMTPDESERLSGCNSP